MSRKSLESQNSSNYFSSLKNALLALKKAYRKSTRNKLEADLQKAGTKEAASLCRVVLFLHNQMKEKANKKEMKKFSKRKSGSTWLEITFCCCGLLHHKSSLFSWSLELFKFYVSKQTNDGEENTNIASCEKSINCKTKCRKSINY